MAWFRCFIRGDNFPGQLAGVAGPAGFYVTRFVEAANCESAEAAAVQALRGEAGLAPPAGYVPSGRATMSVEEVTEVALAQVPQVQPGFAWHPMYQV